MTPSARLRRFRAAVSPLLVVVVALTVGAVYGYVRGEYVTAITVGVGAILASLFLVLTNR